MGALVLYVNQTETRVTKLGGLVVYRPEAPEIPAEPFKPRRIEQMVSNKDELANHIFETVGWAYTAASTEHPWRETKSPYRRRWQMPAARTMIGGTFVTASPLTFPAVVNAVTYVELTPTGSYAQNSVKWTPGNIPLYSLTMTKSVLSRSDVDDYRLPCITPESTTTVVVTGTSTITLTPHQLTSRFIKFTGTTSSNVTVIFPTNWVMPYTLYRATSGSFDVTVKVGSTTGFVLPNNTVAKVYCDGTNLQRVT
jgi:hypothetical protein